MAPTRIFVFWHRHDAVYHLFQGLAFNRRTVIWTDRFPTRAYSKRMSLISVTVPTVERGFRCYCFLSIAIAGLNPSITNIWFHPVLKLTCVAQIDSLHNDVDLSAYNVSNASELFLTLIALRQTGPEWMLKHQYFLNYEIVLHRQYGLLPFLIPL